MIYVLLHLRHGVNEWNQMIEGSAEAIQQYLDGNGCSDKAHYKVLSGQSYPIQIQGATKTTFYVRGDVKCPHKHPRQQKR